MRVIFYVACAITLLFMASLSKADSNELTTKDYRLAWRYGYSGSDLREAHRVAKKTNTRTITNDFMQSLEHDEFDAAQQADQAMDQLILTAGIYLRAEGHDALADEIGLDYQLKYRGHFTRMFLGEKEIGDHPPVSQWIETIHAEIHEAIGDWLCQGSHLHDMYILNHGNVVFKPSMATDLKDYKDHFAGHLIWGWYWEHHGFAGVVSYWLVNAACTGATSGMGLVTFACGPIAGFAENQVDKRIAPPIAERIWKRSGH
jgi:hypothetical protein